MAMWHCPHCGTPQAETARCWVCRRSSTTCSTCRHFRRSVTPGIGFCGLDRTRRPLAGDEIRGCWAGRPAAEAPAPSVEPPIVPPARPRGFVPLDALATGRARGEPSIEAAPAPTLPPAVLDPFERMTLFDVDP